MAISKLLTKAKYIGFYDAAKLVAWGRQFLSELGFLQLAAIYVSSVCHTMFDHHPLIFE